MSTVDAPGAGSVVADLPTAHAEAPGRAIVAASWASNLPFAATAVPAALGADGFDTAATLVALVLFAVSLVVWVWAFARAVVRSAEGDDIAVASLFLLQGSAPRGVKRHLFGSLGLSLVLVAATAAAAPFGIMVPMLPLGLAGLWAARHGTFPARRMPDAPAPGRRPERETGSGTGPTGAGRGSGRRAPGAARPGTPAPRPGAGGRTRSRAAKGAARGRSGRGRPSE